MVFTQIVSALLSLAGILDVVSAAAIHVARDGSSPSLPSDPNTTTYCSWWVDLRTFVSCSTLLEDNLIDLDTFRRWVREFPPCLSYPLTWLILT